MFDIIGQSAVRIKTGVYLVLGLVIIGIINSLILTWVLLGVIMLVALKEAMELFDIDDNRLYIVASITWLVALIYPNPQDLVFVVFMLFASYLAYTKELDKKFDSSAT
jgi:phosphatidate cytidylyltransferase